MSFSERSKFFILKRSFQLFALSLGVLSWGAFLYSHISGLVNIQWPTENSAPLIYSSDHLDDLSYLISCALRRAKKSIYLASFGITDERVVRVLKDISHQKPEIEVTVSFDLKQPNYLKGLPNCILKPYEKKGVLMHQKIVAIDEELILLGSTNLTETSIALHRNLIVGIHSKALFNALKGRYPLQTDSFTFFPLPIEGKACLAQLIQSITDAQRRIYVSLYVLTHPKIIDALISAAKRGIDVQIFIDKGSLRGSSRKSFIPIKQSQISISKNKGWGYLHYKCALIDNTFIFGSANWSKAGFTRNLEYILFLETLPKESLNTVEQMYQRLQRTCDPLQ